MRDVIITGIPRGGTTLAAALLDATKDAVCLSEPPDTLCLQQSCATAAEFATGLAGSFKAIRATLLTGGAILDRRRRDGGAPTNYFGRGDGQRSTEYVEVGRTVPHFHNDFVVGIKHNALFASALPELVACGAFAVLAIIRNPVSALKSWRSLDLPVSRGVLPAAQKYWPELNQMAAARATPVSAQIALYEELAARFLTLGIPLFRYEDFVEEPTALLRAATGRQSVERPASVAIVAPKMPAADDEETIALRDQIMREVAAGRAEATRALYPALG